MQIHQGNRCSLYDNPLHILWVPTYHCNYHCTYCSQLDCRPKGQDWLSLDKIERVFDNLRNLNRSEYILTITGGEPGIYPHLPDAIKYLGSLFANKLRYIHIATNGSRNIELYEAIAELSELVPINLAISIHTEHALHEDINYLAERLSNGVTLIFNLMFNPAKRKETNDFLHQMLFLREKHPFHLSVQTLREPRNGNTIDARYTAEDFAWQEQAKRQYAYVHNYADVQIRSKVDIDTALIQSSVQDGKYIYQRIYDRDKALKDGKLNLVGKYCVQGTHLISIQPDGRASNAICNQTAYTQRPVYESNPFEDPRFCRIVQCKDAVCGCQANDYLQKFASKEEAEDFLRFFKIGQRRSEENMELKQDVISRLSRQKSLLAQIKPETFPLSAYVDQEWYFAKYPDVATSGMTAAEHYQKYGWLENRDPNTWFNAAFYLSQFDQDNQPQINPLAHFVLYGCSEGKQPNAEGIAIS